jgi:site-specific DNA-methyltransferase (adenine-specific)
MWVYGSGFPKSKNLDGDWDGWGTALKPAWEPIILARKPLIGTVAQNVLAHGTGALNVDGCRVPGVPEPTRFDPERHGHDGWRMNATGAECAENASALGRWPANLIHDGSDEVLAAFPQAPGQLADASSSSSSRKTQNTFGAMKGGNESRAQTARPDAGSAARFFYCAKASKKDRGDGNNHPTVKPTELMRYLCRLVTPPGGLILDPFMGSGSTGKAALLEGFRFTGIELNPEYIEIARARIEAALK